MSGPTSVVRTELLEVVDENGRVMIKMSANDGSPSLELTDHDDSSVVLSGSGMAISDDVRHTLISDQMLSIWRKEGAAFSASPDRVRLSDSNGKERASISVVDGSIQLRLQDAEGRPMMMVFEQDNTATLVLFSEMEPSIVLSVSEGSSGIAVRRDGQLVPVIVETSGARSN